jgi:hypothetical protein
VPADRDDIVEDGVVWKKHEGQLQPHIKALVGWEAEVVFVEELMVIMVRTLVNLLMVTASNAE